MSNTVERPPRFDDTGMNLVDPEDKHGNKTDYITTLQRLAIERYVGRGEGLALEIGCGYGRMTPSLSEMGYELVAMDPSPRLVQLTSRVPSISHCVVGALPRLPFVVGAFPTVFLIHVLRSLHVLGIASIVESLGEYVQDGGRLVIIENIRRRSGKHVEEDWIMETFRSQGLTLKQRRCIRFSRAPWIHLMRFNLFPRSLHNAMARAEVDFARRFVGKSRWQYHNVLFEFARES